LQNGFLGHNLTLVACNLRQFLNRNAAPLREFFIDEQGEWDIGAVDCARDRSNKVKSKN